MQVADETVQTKAAIMYFGILLNLSLIHICLAPMEIHKERVNVIEDVVLRKQYFVFVHLVI